MVVGDLTHRQAEGEAQGCAQQQAAGDEREDAQLGVLRRLHERRAAGPPPDGGGGAAVYRQRQRHRERAGAELGDHRSVPESVRMSSFTPAWLVSCGALYSSECFAMMCVARK